MRLPRKLTWQSFVATLAMVCFAPATAATPTANGSSFLDAEESRVDYTRAEIKHPRIACQDLINKSDPDNSIVSATLLSAEPEMCVVRGVISPEVRYIAYLPTRWNGRFYMHGNGDYAGESLDHETGHLARLRAVRHGFIAAFTNTGHDAASEPGGTWAHNNLQKEIDFGYRAVHLTAVVVKKLPRHTTEKRPGILILTAVRPAACRGLMKRNVSPMTLTASLPVRLSSVSRR